MTAKIDLTDLFELFAQTEETPPAEQPISPEAHRWRRVFADNLAAVLRVCADSIGARKVAYENTLTAFLDAAHLDTPSDRCAYCGRLETPDAALQPIGWGARHTWLHSDCWVHWRKRRQAEATAVLAEAGVP